MEKTCVAAGIETETVSLVVLTCCKVVVAESHLYDKLAILIAIGGLCNLWLLSFSPSLFAYFAS